MKYRAKVIEKQGTMWKVRVKGLPRRLKHNETLWLVPEQFTPSERRCTIIAGTQGDIEYVVTKTGGWHVFTIDVEGRIGA
jgi:hypothetical protein